MRNESHVPKSRSKEETPSNWLFFGANLFVIAFLLGSPVDLLAQKTTLQEMTIEESMNVQVITASKRMQQLAKAPATTYVVTEDDIRQYGYCDLKDVLQHLPGTEYGFPQIHIQGWQRGFSGNWSMTKILINGRQVNSLFSGEAFISSQYTLSHMKQIEVLQGLASASYGAGAFIGVIDIITKNSENTEEQPDFSFALGSVDGVPANIGKKNTEGLKSLVKWRLHRFRMDFWYSCERAPDDPDFLNAAKNKLGVGVICDPARNISLSLQGRHTGKIKTNAWDEVGNDTVITIPEYNSVNLTLLAHQLGFVALPDIDLSLSIRNVFDRSNLSPNMRGPSPNCFLAEGRPLFIPGSIQL